MKTLGRLFRRLGLILVLLGAGGSWMAQQMDMQNMQDFMDQMNQNQESLLNHGADADSQDALKEVMNQSSMDFANTPSTETPLLDALDSMMNETSPDSMFQNTSFDMSSFGQ